MPGGGRWERAHRQILAYWTLLAGVILRTQVGIKNLQRKREANKAGDLLLLSVI
jgi:hypothetical protein